MPEDEKPPDETWLEWEYEYMYWGLTLDEIILNTWPDIQESIIFGREIEGDDELF